jgi:hypothetical protein
MRLVTAAVVIVMVGGACASGQPAIETSPGPVPGVTTSSTGAAVRLSSDSYAIEDLVAAPVADVWRVLPQAWADATVPLASVNNARRTLESGTFRGPDRIVGKPLSDFIDCGYTMAGPRVRLWQVSINVTGTVQPDSAGARMATRVVASARARDGTNSGAVTCSSRGVLERIIAGNVRVRLGM